MSPCCVRVGKPVEGPTRCTSKITTPQRRYLFRLLAAQGFARFHDLLKEAFSDWVEPPPGLMDLKELAPDRPDEVRDQDVVIKSAPTNHTHGSLASGAGAARAGA